jgi:hypothetical protein
MGGDGVQSFLEGKRERKRGSSTVPAANNTTKSGAATRVAEGCSWRLEVKNDQRKLGRWAELKIRKFIQMIFDLTILQNICK